MVEEMKKVTVNGFSVICLFVLDDKVIIYDVRKKNKKLVVNFKVYKMLVRFLELLFIDYVGYCKCLGFNVFIIFKINNCYIGELSR